MKETQEIHIHLLYIYLNHIKYFKYASVEVWNDVLNKNAEFTHHQWRYLNINMPTRKFILNT